MNPCNKSVLPILQLILLATFLLTTSLSSAAQDSNYPTQLYLSGRCATQPGGGEGTPIGGQCSQTSSNCIGAPFCSTCQNEVCHCKDAFQYSSELNICIGHMVISGPCDTTLPEACAGYHLDTSKCVFGYCQCVPDHYPSPDLLRCLPKVDELGGACEISMQCKAGRPGEFSHCSDIMCKCLPEAVNPEGGHTCLAKRDKVGDDQLCEMDAQCIDNAICLGGSCHCGEGFSSSPDNGTCYRKAEFIGDPCIPEEGDNNDDAGHDKLLMCSSIEGAICDSESGKCICEAGKVPSGDKRKCVDSSGTPPPTINININININLGHCNEDCTNVKINQ